MRFELGNIAAVEQYRARSRAHQADDRIAERRLAHAVAADDGKNAALEPERNALQRMRLAVIDLEILNLQDRLGRRRDPAASI